MPTACRPKHAGDAEAHKMEGAFYVWRADEIDALLGDDAAVVKRRFGIEPDGNAPSDPQQEFTGKNLLYVAEIDRRARARTGTVRADAIADVLGARAAAHVRGALERPRPHLDDKVLTAWNGLMIAAFARAARVLRALGDDGARRGDAVPRGGGAGRGVCPRRACGTADDGTLLRRYRDGDAEIDGYAEDYAYLIFGLLELFQADPIRRGSSGRSRCSAGRTSCSGTRRRRLVQHDRPRSDRPAADEGGLRRRGADGQFRVDDESADALAPARGPAAGPSTSSGRCGSSAHASSRSAAPCR